MRTPTPDSGSDEFLLELVVNENNNFYFAAFHFFSTDKQVIIM